ncbi:WhiB family transcriptional regulator [Catenulispora yoronensis]|uniref:Transcriptional regulator WhiB n=1 Tax=Catenulispora yoronensis TaxID=450799 RepID=A0ABP5H8L2_9ACTN
MRLLLINDDPVRRHQWQDRAACHDFGSELFFESDNELRVVRARREQAAKKVCAMCPVRRECLRFAESGPEVFGVWGGTTQRERAVRRRRRKRARGASGRGRGAGGAALNRRTAELR